MTPRTTLINNAMHTFCSNQTHQLSTADLLILTVTDEHGTRLASPRTLEGTPRESFWPSPLTDGYYEDEDNNNVRR